MLLKITKPFILRTFILYRTISIGPFLQFKHVELCPFIHIQINMYSFQNVSKEILIFACFKIFESVMSNGIIIWMFKTSKT